MLSWYFLHISLCFSEFSFMELFQWFFIALTVLPGRYSAILTQLVWTTLSSPFGLRYSFYFRNRIQFSASDQSHFLVQGLSWLCHLSRQYLPSRPWIWSANLDHFCAPNFWTSRSKMVSSSTDHAFYFFLSFFCTNSFTTLEHDEKEQPLYPIEFCTKFSCGFASLHVDSVVKTGCKVALSGSGEPMLASS